MIQNIIFDMDGTLYSSEDMILPTYERGIANFKKENIHVDVPYPTLEKIVSLLGFPIHDIYSTLFPSLNGDQQKELRGYILKELLSAIRNKEGILFNDVSNIIHNLYNNNYTLFIASNGQKEYLNAILETYSLTSLFQPLITLNYTTICDKGDILLEYQKAYHFEKESVIMVGDRDSDWDAAKKLGCSFIGCHYGHGDHAEIATAEHIIYSFKELPPKINTLSQQKKPT